MYVMFFFQRWRKKNVGTLITDHFYFVNTVIICQIFNIYLYISLSIYLLESFLQDITCIWIHKTEHRLETKHNLGVTSSGRVIPTARWVSWTVVPVCKQFLQMHMVDPLPTKSTYSHSVIFFMLYLTLNWSIFSGCRKQCSMDVQSNLL